MTPDSKFEREQTEAAASEAAQIGGIAGDEDLDPAERPVREGGGGENGGFEDAQQELIEHSSHATSSPRTRSSIIRADPRSRTPCVRTGSPTTNAAASSPTCRRTTVGAYFRRRSGNSSQELGKWQQSMHST